MKRVFIPLRILAVALALSGLAITAGTAWWFRPQRPLREEFERGLEAAGQGNFPEVLHSAERLKGNAEFSSEEHLLRGIYWLKLSRPVTAMAEFARLDPAGEVREPALLYSGEACYRLGRLADAARLFTTLAAERPGHVEAHRWLAAIHYDLGAMQQAMDELDIVVRLNPTDYRPHVLKGHILSDLERFPAATTEYTLAVTAAPPQNVLAEILPALARVQMQQRDYAAALQTLAQADRSAARLALEAECELSLGKHAEAWQRIHEAEELDPEQVDVLRLLGRLHLDAGNPESALAPLRAVLEQDPHDHQTRHQLSQALRLLGKPEEADEESRRSARAIALKQKLAELNTAAIERPRDPAVREQIAKLCEQLGKPELATTWRKAAAECRQQTDTQPALGTTSVPFPPQ